MLCKAAMATAAPALVHGADAVAGLDIVVAHVQVLLHAVPADGLLAHKGLAVLRLGHLRHVLHLGRPVVHLW